MYDHNNDQKLTPYELYNRIKLAFLSLTQLIYNFDNNYGDTEYLALVKALTKTFLANYVIIQGLPTSTLVNVQQGRQVNH